MRYKCAKFQLAIFTNKLCMMKGRGLTYSNCIKNWDEIAISSKVCLAISLRLVDGFQIFKRRIVG